MSGTKAGGAKAAAVNKQRDPDFYKKIGQKGGRNGHTGGFASNEVGSDGLTGRERASAAGTLGGRISRRGESKSPRFDSPTTLPEPDWEEVMVALNG